MTSTLLVLLLLSQSERPDEPTAGALPPLLPASVAGGRHYLTRLEATGLALLPGGEGGGAEAGAGLVRREDWDSLSRFRAAGPSGLPVVEAPFPEGFSVYGEAVVGWDGVRLGGLRQRHLHLSLGAEAFTWGRVDVDGRLAVQLAERRVEVAVNALAAGVGKPEARFLYSGEVRWRFGGWLYAMGQGGTLLFPPRDGAPRPGAFASVGLGVEHAR